MTESKAQKKNLQQNLFASFRLGDHELALSVSALQEVVNEPEKITAIPLAPSYVVGLFNLRGKVIPVVDMGQLLQIEKDPHLQQRKIAILAVDGVCIGLRFDSTSEILNVQEEDIFPFEAEGKQSHSVVRSALKLSQGSRIVEVIDPLSLLKVENIQQILTHQQGSQAELNKRQAKRIQCISFHAGGIEFGLSISAIREIIRVPELKKNVLTVEYCLGVVNLRGMVIPILDFEKFLKMENLTDPSAESRRIIILKLESMQVGIMVHSVDSIVSLFEDEILPIPLFQQNKSEMMRGLLARPQGNVLFLNENKILSDGELLEISRGYNSIYAKKDQAQSVEAATATERRTYLSFKLDHLFSTRLGAIDEIAKITEPLVRPPGYPSYVNGILHRRGEVITVIDLRAYYGMKPLPQQDARVLIVKGATAKYGLLVDSVESIDTVDESKKVKIPSLLSKDIANTMQGDMKDVVEMTDLTGNKKTFVILEVAELLRKIESGAGAA